MSSNEFVLKSIDLKNWKAFTEARLELETTGFTGIGGSNGSGKSSFIDALLWGLYGFQPDGTTKDELRSRGVDFSKDETVVKITFEHAGQTIEVSRQMTGKRHEVSANVFLDGIEAAIDTGSTARAWITNRLGMDVQGFKTMVVVMQKELDSIVDAKPAPRREAIERLAGIEEMNLALKKSREEANDLKRTTDVLPGSAEESEAALALYEETLEQYGQAEKSYDHSVLAEKEARETLDANVQANNEATKKLNEGNFAYTHLREIQEAYRAKVANVNSLTTQLEDAQSEIIDIDVTQHESLKIQWGELTQKIKDENNSFSQNSIDYQGAKQGLNSTKTRLVELEDAFMTENNRVDFMRTALEALGDPVEASIELGGLTAKLDDERERTGRLRGQLSDITESINTLSNFVDSAHCPTCQTTLKDPQKLVESFIEQKHRLENELSANAKNITSFTGRAEELRVFIDEHKRKNNMFENTKEGLEVLRKNVEIAKKAVEDAEASLSTLVEPNIEAHEKSVQDLETERQLVVQRGEAVKHALKTLERANKISEQLDIEKRTLSEVKPTVDAASERYNSFGDLQMLDEQVQKANLKIQELRAKSSNAYEHLRTAENEKNTLAERSRHQYDAYQKEEQLVIHKIDLLAKLEDRTSVVELISEYRNERVSRIAPEISSTATELISQMTNGRFIEVVMDENFATSVIKDNGHAFSTNSLSGGEKSIVALALRIAIASLVTGDNAGLLWLDEALPAQDAERRDAILSVLRDLPIQQIVMINHTHEAEDIVDNIIRVTYNEGGSTIS